jgi:hypothetical protein
MGEVVTNTELMQQIQDHWKNDESTYHYGMHLNVDWAFKIITKDDQALCSTLWDAQHCGNISRFLNHRCQHANLINMPIKTDNQVP